MNSGQLQFCYTKKGKKDLIMANTWAEKISFILYFLIRSDIGLE
jgi:hypothetical protein